MNQPPEEGYTRIPHEQLHQIVSESARAVGLPDEKAERLGEILSHNDLRGVFSHGSHQVATYSGKGYARLMRDGELNDDPELEVLDETPVSVHIDGDGGLGYFPADEATTRAIEKAKSQGMAAMATRNHGHFGAAGHYARRAAEEDLLAFVTSGVQQSLSPGDPIYSAGGGSPMSFCAPTDEEYNVVLDFGAMHDLYSSSPYRDAVAELAPGLVLRSIGLGSFCQSWGGLLPGLAIDGPREFQAHSGANQGSFAFFFRIDLFSDPDRFKSEMDTYVRQVHELEPLEGFDPRLPGGPEAERAEQYREEGVPISDERREKLEELADDLGIEIPWA
jgi:LDH2 family malate/lactate/ureidoglycolate dehydrogenase